MSMSIVCPGCGAPLQMDDPDKPGYVPDAALLREEPLCRRCYRLRHYGQLERADVTEDMYRATVARVLSRPSLLLYVIDVFDVQGSFLRGLTGMLAQHDVIAVVNKWDLLPHVAHSQAVLDWLRRELVAAGVKPVAVLAVSARTGRGVEELALAVRGRGRNKQVVALGMANVGKSSLLNRLLADDTRFTTSPYPGTTLGAVVLTVAGGGPVIVDTPGLLGRHRLQDRVCAASLPLIVPRERLRPRVYQLQEGQTLFLGGLARLDFVEGQAGPFVVYVANQLHVHRTKTSHAEDLYERQRGMLLNPPCADCDASLRTLEMRMMRFRAGNPADIVIPGLGWIRLAGDAAKIAMHVPVAIELSVRPALFGGHGRRAPQRSAPGERGTTARPPRP